MCLESIAQCHVSSRISNGHMILLQCDFRPPVHIKSCSSLASNISTGSPTSSATSSSFCFNEAPGRFWKALELKAVHPVQTSASSSVPASLDQTLLCLLRYPVSMATANRTEEGPMISTDVNREAQLWSGPSVSLCGSDLQANILYV